MGPNVKPLNLEELKKIENEHQQKQLIGERLFPKIHVKEPTKAGKLTSMILTLEIEQIFPLLNDDGKLHDMIQNTLKIMHEREARDKQTGQSVEKTIANVTERVNEMRQQHKQTVENLLSPNSGNGNGNASTGDTTDL